MESRLSAVEQRVGTGPGQEDIDQSLAELRRAKESAIDAQDFEQAAALRDSERQLEADIKARQLEWAASHPDLGSLAEAFHELKGEVERLHQLLRRHGTEREESPADGAGDADDEGSAPAAS
jgi:hypothetical protein